MEVRIIEHINKPDFSTFGHHIKCNNHNFSPQKNAQIVHNEIKGELSKNKLIY